MVTYKVLLDERRVKTDGTYAVIVRVTNNRKANTINTGVTVLKDNWDFKNTQVKSSYSNSALLNKKITEFYLKVQKAILELGEEEEFNFEYLKEKLNSNSPLKAKTSATTFKDYSKQLVDSMLSVNRAGNAIIYQTATNKLLAYSNTDKLKFTEITYSFLEGFRNSLLKSGLKANSISNYFRTIRAIYNKAIKEKIVDRSHYPFLDITVKTERTAKRSITVEELKKIAALELKVNSQQWHTRNYFLLSFALRGASFTDLAYLKPENIRKGYITYKRRKTGKELKIKIFPYTNQILQIYNAQNKKYLLPIVPTTVTEDSLEAKKVLFQWIKTTNKYLKRMGANCNIEDEITTYVTRHTFATVAKKRLGYSNEIIAECLGHEYGNKITNTYLDSYDQSLIDEVNEKAINILIF